MRSTSGSELDVLLRDAVADGVTPGCVALVWRSGAQVYAGAHGRLATHGPAHARAPVRVSARYDLASLTKVLSTTTLLALAVGEGRLALDDRLPDPLAIAASRPTLRDLLEHASGLAAHREFFFAPWSLGVGRRSELIEAVRTVPLAGKPRAQAIYSDLGFILLGAWLELLHGARLDELFHARVAAPLGIADQIGYPGLEPLTDEVASTEVYDAALHGGTPQHWYALREQAGQPIARGLVHDDNCLVMAGVAGHAGLFGTAHAVLTIARAWLEQHLPGLDPHTSARVIASFTTPSSVPGSTRRLGFDGPAPDGSGSTADALSQQAFGHLGFTGTSVWIDPRTESIYVLLSNRVHPVREDQRIRELRRAFHVAAASLTCV
jgi:CubicO group peptidase (beta-lactamase class C family)